MISHFTSTKLLRALGVLAAFALSAAANAAPLNFNVWIDTSSLVGNPAGPFSLDFQLNDGSTLGDGNNWASLTNFQFGGGAALGSATTFGGASGDLLSGVILNDSDTLLNEFYQTFTAGSWLSFNLSLTTNVDAGDTPDLFSFAILDVNLMNLATQSLNQDAFLQVTLDGAAPTIATFASADQSIGAPSVPDTLNCGIWVGGLVALGAIVRRRYPQRA